MIRFCDDCPWYLDIICPGCPHDVAGQEKERDVKFSRKVFAARLRHYGFERLDTVRDPLIYTKDMGHRRLEVQLLKDGKHRASHWALFPGCHRLRHMCTPPTEFSTLEEMDRAVKIEATRTDYPPQMIYPRRFQLSRAPGWRMPPNSVKADRSTPYGNPFCIGEPTDMKQARRWGWDLSAEGKVFVAPCAVAAVRKFTFCLVNDEAIHPHLREKLGGKNIGCWCALDQPCHVDTVLVVANFPAP